MDAPTDPDLSLDQLVELERLDAEADAEADAAPARETADIVLPWWQHPMNIVTLVVTAAILAAMAGWLVGDSGADPAHNDVDVGFLQDMRVHHEQAVLMSLIYRNLPDTDPALRTVSRSIVQGQSQEIGAMSMLLGTFGESPVNETGIGMVWMGMSSNVDDMPGMATPDELDALGRLDGVEADELFVSLMTEHHRGGVDMAQFAADRADNEIVREMATSMAAAQREEIAEMAALLQR